MQRVLLSALIVCLLIPSACGQRKNISLKLQKKRFIPNEEIKVYFTAPADFDNDAWVGIIPSHVKHGYESENDKYDLDYYYLEKRTSGELTFRAPDEPGFYDVRMNDTDKDGYEVASITFEVRYTEVSLKINKKVFEPREDITVTYTAPSNYPPNAWIGIVPANIAHGSEDENERYNLTYKCYGGSISGQLFFSAPDEPGSYDIRMHDSGDNGNEVAHVSFEVKKR
jgi:hypothetical protein